jgi:hypothetical protein
MLLLWLLLMADMLWLLEPGRQSLLLLLAAQIRLRC